MLGVSFGFHDAAMTLIKHGEIVYASHSERYSRVKNDPLLHRKQLSELQQHGWRGKQDSLTYYEKPWKKRLRQVLYGEPKPAKTPGRHLMDLFNGFPTGYSTVDHHHAHAAAGYYTSPYSRAAVIVADAIGEFDTVSIWLGDGTNLKKVESTRYPHSLGLLYSAFTQRCGFKPNEQEHVMMGMAAFGRPIYVDEIRRDFFDMPDWDKAWGCGDWRFRLKENVHRGIGDWMPMARTEDLAASIQSLFDQYLLRLFCYARRTLKTPNVVFQGGVALNCTSNSYVIKHGPFDDYWIMPNPGDAGASMGAALIRHGDFVEWPGPYLGTYVASDAVPAQIVNTILALGMCGLARGRAEFGPRALGNRSLFADPRVPVMKNRVNQVKQREEFRPFAPMILAEHLDDYFITDGADCRYMQYALPCKRPSDIPAVVHINNTGRVQSVGKDNSFLHDLLTLWYERTGCPVLLNTSLNIKGEPLVNTREDADNFARTHKVTVL